MLRLLRLLLIAVAILAVVIGAGLFYLLQDPNRFKPQLEEQIARHTNVPLTIGGDLDWRLWPPLSISAEDLAADYEGQSWQVGRVTLDLDAIAVLRNPEAWRVQSLTVRDVHMRQEGSELHVSRATLEDLAPNAHAPLTAALTFTSEGQPPIPVSVEGGLQLDPEALELSLRDARVTTPSAVGLCNLTATPVADPTPAPPATEADLIPVDTFRGFSWNGNCQLDWVELDGQRFEDVAVDLANDGGRATISARMPRFFGGEALADVAIDARSTPVRWTLTPTLSGVDSRQLLGWLDQRLRWAASLAYGGTLTFEGNTADALIASMSGETRFDGGQGQLDIAKIRGQLLTLATMFNEGERISGWPEMWGYQKFVGNWRIDRQHHVLDAALDNLSLKAEGDYTPGSDEIDMLLTLVFANNPDLPVFDLNPILYDLPIPIRCRGAIDDPTCRVDNKVAQRIVASAIGNPDSALRGKLEQKIDEDVPEKYRDAARSLLDVLGRSRREDANKEDTVEN